MGSLSALPATGATIVMCRSAQGLRNAERTTCVVASVPLRDGALGSPFADLPALSPIRLTANGHDHATFRWRAALTPYGNTVADIQPLSATVQSPLQVRRARRAPAAWRVRDYLGFTRGRVMRYGGWHGLHAEPDRHDAITLTPGRWRKPQRTARPRALLRTRHHQHPCLNPALTSTAIWWPMATSGTPRQRSQCE